MDSKNDSNTDKNSSTNLTIRKSKEIGMESMVVVIQHEEQHQSTSYSCQMQWDTFLLDNFQGLNFRFPIQT